MQQRQLRLKQFVKEGTKSSNYKKFFQDIVYMWIVHTLVVTKMDFPYPFFLFSFPLCPPLPSIVSGKSELVPMDVMGKMFCLMMVLGFKLGPPLDVVFVFTVKSNI